MGGGPHDKAALRIPLGSSTVSTRDHGAGIAYTVRCSAALILLQQWQAPAGLEQPACMSGGSTVHRYCPEQLQCRLQVHKHHSAVSACSNLTCRSKAT